MIMVPNRSSDSSSDLVAHWPAAYDAPALPIVEALVSLSGAKGELHGGHNKEPEQYWARLALSGDLTYRQPQYPTNAPSEH